MPLNLVNYSDSSSEEDNETLTQQPVPKSKLPNPFGKSTKTDEEEDSNNAEHNGRTRSFPHERGIWATYVYIHCPRTDWVINMQEEFMKLLKSTSALGALQFHPIEELHMSLTRTVVLRHHWIDEFIRSVESRLKAAKRFWIHLDSIQIYCNDNQTRTFVSLSMTDSNVKHDLDCIVKQLNSCLEEFKLPPFYEDSSFHVSILWCLGDKRSELQSMLPQLLGMLKQMSADDEDQSSLVLNVEQLFCKIGNKLYNFHF